MRHSESHLGACLFTKHDRRSSLQNETERDLRKTGRKIKSLLFNRIQGKSMLYKEERISRAQRYRKAKENQGGSTATGFAKVLALLSQVSFSNAK